MSDEAAFLSAIAADPGDDTARLAFADWLDDRADFRGAFVRAGVAFDRTPPYDPERFRLAARLREMPDTPAFKEWLPGHPALKWGWRRGLLSLTADTPKLPYDGPPPELAARLASEWVERVEFAGYTHGAIPSWESTFGLVRRVRELLFETDNYGPDALARLREWPHLRRLRISYLEEPWSELAALPHLRWLTLHNPDWTMMPELPGARLPHLEVFDLNKEWYADLPDWNLCFPNLRSLTLAQYNAFPDEQCERFAACPRLRHLAFNSLQRPFTRVGLNSLAKATELRSLSLGPAPRGTIEPLAELPHLERLHVEGKAAQVRGLESLTGLRWLFLSRSKFTKAVALQVCALPQLARLDLWCDDFEPGAVAALTGAPALRVLGVSNLHRSKPPVAEMSRLDGLRCSLIAPPGLAPEDSAALKTALPNCLFGGEWYYDANEFEW